MKRTLSAALIFIVVFSTFSMSTIQSSRSETEYPHRRKIIVDNSDNPETLTNYQVFVNVTYDSDMQADFDDLRFKWYDETSGEEVDIDHWLDKYLGSEYALVWVEVPEIRGAGEEVLYMYYGDPDAVSESNGEETFVFFDGFSTDTTSNYELWSSIWPLPEGNPYNEFSWDPNGWLFVNASVRECPGRNSNIHVTHKTAQIDATEEKYWLETRGKAFGTGVLDYFGVGKAYKYGSVPDDNYELFCLVRRRNQTIQSLWGPSWEFFERGLVPTAKDVSYRFGVGTSSDGTVIGRFYDDDYNEIETIVNQTIHQDNKWWVDLLASRLCTGTWTTLCAYFDYVRVRKFTDPEPTTHVLPEYFELIEDYFPHWKFSQGEKWYPCSFYFDNDSDAMNNPENYEHEIVQWNISYVYIHVAEDEYDLTIEYWLYYAFNDHQPWGREPKWKNIFDHEHDWDSTVSIVFDKSNLDEPRVVYFFHHWGTGFKAQPLLWEDVPNKDGDHVVAYVANGTHGAYPTEKMTWGDIWKDGGLDYGSEDFNWIIAEECAFEDDHDDCWVPHITVGIPQNEPNEGYWPHHYRSTYPLNPTGENDADPAPWHRREWEKGMLSTLTLEIEPSIAGVGEAVTFSGQLIPQISTTVYLKYRRQGTSDWRRWWKPLRTGSDGRFSESFTPPGGLGITEFVAEWSGNEEDPPALSPIATLTITTRR